MKKTILILICILFTFSLAGCSYSFMFYDNAPFNADSDYHPTDEEILTTRGWGSYANYTYNERRGGAEESATMQQSAFSGIHTIFDFTADQPETHKLNFSITNRSGRVRIVVIKDKSELQTVVDTKSSVTGSETLDFEPGRYEIKVVAEQSRKSKITLKLDRPMSLYSYKTDEAERVHDEALSVAEQEYDDVLNRFENEFEEQMAQLEQTRDAALDQIEKEFEEAQSKAEELYNAKVEDLDKTFDSSENTEAAKDSYYSGKDQAREDYETARNQASENYEKQKQETIDTYQQEREAAADKRNQAIEETREKYDSAIEKANQELDAALA